MKLTERIKAAFDKFGHNLSSEAQQACEPLFQELVILEQKAELVDEICLLKRSVISVVSRDGVRTFNGGVLGVNDTPEHSIEDSPYLQRVVNFCLKTEVQVEEEAQRLRRINERINVAVNEAVVRQQQTDFAPPEKTQAPQPQMQFDALANEIAVAVLGVLRNIPDGATVG